MKITCLVENTALSPPLEPKHGLSLFIETADRQIVFDLGPDATAVSNAQHLGIDLSQTGLAIISHGHSDHGGGLDSFLKVNPTAEILMTRAAAGDFYVQVPGNRPRQISLDKGITANTRCRFINRDQTISNTLSLFTGFDTGSFVPSGNATLFRKSGNGKMVRDDFGHELALLVREDQKTILFTGCSHSGISNMISTVLNRTKLTSLDVVVGGFHLFNPSTGECESRDRMDILAEELSGFGQTRFYTGHCTGARAFDHLKKKLGSRLQPLSTGTRILV